MADGEFERSNGTLAMTMRGDVIDGAREVNAEWASRGLSWTKYHITRRDPLLASSRRGEYDRKLLKLTVL